MDPELWELFQEGESDDEVAAIIRLGQVGSVPPGVRVISQFGEIVTVRLPRGSIPGIRENAEVTSFKAPGPSMGPDLELDNTQLLEALPEEIQPIDQRRPASLDATGRGIVIGIVDWGFDFGHPEFRNEDGSTRILAIWDQRGGLTGTSPQPCGYGRVHTREDIDRALAVDDPYTALGYHPADADIGRGSHGTLVASIAAGNGRSGGPVGIAPEADLIFVHLATWGQDRSAKLGNSVTILEAIDFISQMAGDRPCCMNGSIGRTGEQHDGTTLVEQALDILLRSTPGRVICQSAGNYFQRRQHASGQLRPAEERTLLWEISAVDVTPNELEIWYPGRDRMELEITSPDESISAKIALGERAPLTLHGRTVGTAYHRAVEPNSLDNHIDVFLYPDAPTGGWEITLRAVDVVDGRYHAWIERDAACQDCQSHFQADQADPTSTTGTICNGQRTIAVGAYNAHHPDQPVAAFSSMGPTRDGRLKPDLCAPGVAVLGARSASYNSEDPAPLLTRMSGTSFAAPHVTGCVALMLQVAPRPLRIEEVHNLLLASTHKVYLADELPGRVGSGYLDIESAVEAARNVGRLSPGTRLAGNEEKKDVVAERLTENSPTLKEGVAMQIEQEFHPMDALTESEQLETWDDAMDLDESDTEDLDTSSPVGYVHVSSSSRVPVHALSSTPDFTATNLDEALQFALRQTGRNSFITGTLLTGTQYEVFRCNFSFLPTSVIEFEAIEQVAALVLSGDFVYIPSDPLAATRRWVKLARSRELYALSDPDRNAQRASWVNKIYAARASMTIPDITVDRAWLDRRSMPELRLILAFFEGSIFQVLPINEPDSHHLGGKIGGVTLPVGHLPIHEPDCYVAAIAGREGLMEAINAYDMRAGVSLGPIQLNAIGGSLFQFLARVSDADPFLFNRAFGSLSWSIRTHVDHPDLVINAGTSNEMVLHGAGDNANVRQNVGYLQSGTPGNSAFNQIDAGFRHRLTGAFRTLVVWPHIQEFIMEITVDANLAPALQVIHQSANNIPPLNLADPNRETYILKTMLLSAHVRFSSCLRPFLSALRRWNTPAEKLNHWRDALNDESIAWGACNRDLRNVLIRRLTQQEPEARRAYDRIRRAMHGATSSETEAHQSEHFREHEGDCGCRNRLVELAEEAISNGPALASAGEMLDHVLSSTGRTGTFLMIEEGHRRISPAAMFDGFLYPGREQLRNHLEKHFEVIALPRTRLIGRLQPGDILLRRCDGGFGHVAIIVSPELRRLPQLLSDGLKPESFAAGKYAQVVEAGAHPHRLSDAFARRVANEQDWLGHDTMILRVREAFGEDLSDDAPQGDFPVVRTRPTTITGLRAANGSLVDEDRVRSAIARWANDELQWWANGPNGSQITECQQVGGVQIGRERILNTYWQGIRGDPNHDPCPPHNGSWSAVFVCYCIRAACLQLGISQFPLAPIAAHFKYSKFAYQRRFQTGQAGYYWAYAPNERRIQIGDIIVKERNQREPPNPQLAPIFYNLTLADLATRDRANTHGDIVVDINNNRAVVIGGNVGQSVSRNEYILTPDGKVDTTQTLYDASHVFTVLGIQPLHIRSRGTVA